MVGWFSNIVTDYLNAITLFEIDWAIAPTGARRMQHHHGYSWNFERPRNSLHLITEACIAERCRHIRQHLQLPILK
ncbi:hypothetical protein J6590_014468 [Homalodisca vitripennis]|nr:hypothetical protein J6590_014468 [Homalodisca vitripennis]